MPRRDLRKSNSTPAHAVLKLKGRDWLDFGPRQRKAWLQRAFHYWRDHGFPYLELTPEEIRRELRWLVNSQPNRILRRGKLRHSAVGLRVANYFHPYMWHVPVHDYKTPVERFADDDCLCDCLQKAAAFFPDRSCWNGQCLRSTLRIYRGTTRVSNFRPTVARAICARFSSDGHQVLDFSAGYGGRLLGCLTLPRRYVGIDPCRAQIQGLRNMIRNVGTSLPGTAKVIQGCAEDVLTNFRANSVDLVFSSPPYFNHERYSNEPSQSYLRFPTYPLWKERFLERVVALTHRLLRRGAMLVINVADPPGLPLVEDTVRICQSKFRLFQTISMPLFRLPLQRNLTGNAFKYESILVFRKE